ncbi:hypothetical protein AURDEDRAFT_146620 [Auricularia subglabra TFB-10046 SS5]|nr:hypothetical protein AURDEDRAFT_146620 [Auricularia subglabra TFB-10046 SS5]
MLAIDHPTANDSPVDYGTFVVIALDPEASVADLRDEDATRQARLITPTRCLAIANAVGEFVLSPKAGGPVLSRNFQLVGRGLPGAPYSWAATPVSPAAAHPETQRPAVHPSAPLPWDDCHIYSMAQHTARVSRIYQSPNSGPFFPLDEYGEISLTVEEDRARSDSNSEVSVPSSVSSHGSATGTGNGQNFQSRVSEAFDEGRAMRELLPGLVDLGLPEVNIYVQLWVDINAAGELGQPEDFFQQGRKVKEIEKQWADRVVADIRAKRPQTTAWLEGVTEADAPDFSEDNQNALVEDESIMPEDAIEHRIERANPQQAISSEYPAPTPSYSAPGIETAFIPPQPELVATHTPSLSGSSITSRTDASDARSECPADKSVHAYGLRKLFRFATSVFQSLYSRLNTLVAKSRSFFWSLLWRRPFS